MYSVYTINQAIISFQPNMITDCINWFWLISTFNARLKITYSVLTLRVILSLQKWTIFCIINLIPTT